jgi:hypothetical protein
MMEMWGSQAGDRGKRSRLFDTFRYYYHDLLLYCNNNSVPIPQAMVAQDSDMVFGFVNDKCPHYLFQLINSNIGNPELNSMALSLMLCVMMILKEKSVGTTYFEQGSYRAQLDSDLGNWAQNSMAEIASSQSVAICMNVLMKTASTRIIELTMTMLAHLVSVSEDAALQMLLSPGSPDTDKELFKVGGVAKARRSTAASILSVNSKTSSKSESRRNEQLQSSTGKSRQSSDGSGRKPQSDGVHSMKGTPKDQIPYISNMLNIVALNRSRHLVVASYAEIIRHIFRWDEIDSQLASEVMARSAGNFSLSSVGISPSKVPMKKGSSAKSNGFRMDVRSLITGPFVDPNDFSITRPVDSHPGQPRPQSRGFPLNFKSNPGDNLQGYNGLKLLLFFLVEHTRYFNGEDDTLRPKRSGDQRDFEPGVSQVSAESLLSSREFDRVFQSHQHVLLALCDFIFASPSLRNVLVDNRRVEKIVRVAVKPHLKFTEVKYDVDKALGLLRNTREAIAAQQQQKHPSRLRPRPSSILNVSQSISINSSIKPRSSHSSQRRPSTPLGFLSSRDLDRRPVEKDQSLQDTSLDNYSFGKMNPLQLTGSIDVLDMDQQGNVLSVEMGPDSPQGSRQSSRVGSRQGTRKFKVDGAGDASVISTDVSGASVSDRVVKPTSPNVYDRPESPARRGMTPAMRGSDKPLHKNVFNALPSTPSLPDRIEPDVIIDNTERIVDTLARSLEFNNKKATKIMANVYREGFVRDGRHSVSIYERARRSYAPRPSTTGSMSRPGSRGVGTPGKVSRIENRIMSAGKAVAFDEGSVATTTSLGSKGSLEFLPLDGNELIGHTLDGMDLDALPTIGVEYRPSVPFLLERRNPEGASFEKAPEKDVMGGMNAIFNKSEYAEKEEVAVSPQRMTTGPPATIQSMESVENALDMLFPPM